MNKKKPRHLVAVVDDDRSIQTALNDLLESAGLVSESFGSAEEFLASDQLSQASCLVLDIRMPGMSGLDLQARLKTEGRHIPIIFITARGDTQTRTQAMEAGALEFLSKPFDDEVLLERVRAALKG